MDSLEVAQQRHAVREYRDTPLDTALIERLLGVAVLAPSAMNLQPWASEVITVRSTDTRTERRNAYRRTITLWHPSCSAFRSFESCRGSMLAAPTVC